MIDVVAVLRSLLQLAQLQQSAIQKLFEQHESLIRVLTRQLHIDVPEPPKRKMPDPAELAELERLWSLGRPPPDTEPEE